MAWLSRKAAGEYVGRDERWMKEAQFKGLIPYSRVGRRPVFNTDDLDAYMAATRHEATEGPLAQRKPPAPAPNSKQAPRRPQQRRRAGVG